MTLKKHYRIIIASAIFALVLFMFGAASSHALTKTDVKGIKTKIVMADIDSDITMNITISPRATRSIRFQFYDTEGKKWGTKAKFTASSKGKATIRFTREWKDLEETWYRVVVDKTNKYEQYVSKKIVVKNSKAVPLDTVITGLETAYDPVDTKNVLKDTVNISPACKRTIKIYAYNDTAKKYELKSTGSLPSTKVAVITYPDTWTKKANTKFKIVIPEVKYDHTKKNTALKKYSAVVTVHNREKDKFSKTTISGLDTSMSGTQKSTLSDKISVAPAYGRKGILYIFDETSQKWAKKDEYTTQNKYSSNITIKYPKSWKAHGYSKWKIEFPKTKEDAVKNLKELPAGSKTIKVRNTYYSTLGSPTEKDKTFVTGIVVEASSGKIIFEQGQNIRRRPASTTKLMTGLVLNEKINAGKISKVTISQVAKNYISYVYSNDNTYSTGTWMYAGNALYAMLLPSNNLVAESIGVAVSGTPAKFGTLMTKRAKELGCTNTIFSNACGLDVPDHFTTAYDMSKIARFILTNEKMELMRNVVKTWSFIVPTSKGNRKVTNSNPYKYRSDCLGMKTGTCVDPTRYVSGVDRAKNCFVGAFKYNKKTYITVVMNVPLGANNSAQKKAYTDRLLELMKYNVNNGITA